MPLFPSKRFRLNEGPASLKALCLLSGMMGLTMISWIRCGAVNPSAPDPAEAVPDGPGQSLRRKIESLTGAQTRVVWARDTGKAKDTFANGTQLILMGLDTRETSEGRVLAAPPGNYSRPLLSPDGRTVIFSRRQATGEGDAAKWQSEILALDWLGGTPRRLRSGYAVETWRHPATGETWVYAFTSLRDGIGANPEGSRLYRFPLNHPDGEEVIWDQGLMCGDNIQVNRAGTMASGLIPWPNAGTFEFPSGRFIRYRNGCWPSLAPDDSGVVWVFDGTHENLRMFLPGVDGNWRVAMDGAEGLKGKAAYHPRWSNHPRVLAFTGPHPVKVSGGSGKVSVILGSFNASLTALEGSVSLRNSTGGPDCYPDVWVAGGERVDLDLQQLGSRRIQELTARARIAPAAAWEAQTAGLCFVWERATSNNQVPGERREASVTPKRHARFGPRFEMLTEGGVFVVDPASAAAIRRTLASGLWSMEMAVTPLAAGGADPRVIFRAGPDLEIQQSLHDFILRAGGKDWHLGAGLSAGQTTHLALSSSTTPGGPPVVWMNGQPQDVRPMKTGPPPALPATDTTEVQFGARWDGSAAWAGRLETIAFHASAIDPARITAHAAWWREKLTGFRPPARTVVRARLMEASPRTRPDGIGAYRRAWTSALYEKTALVSGPDPGAIFGVAHWTILDGIALTGPPGNPGEERELILEPMADHPEMDSEYGSEEILSDGQALFLDAGPPGA